MQEAVEVLVVLAVAGAELVAATMPAASERLDQDVIATARFHQVFKLGEVQRQMVAVVGVTGVGSGVGLGWTTTGALMLIWCGTGV